jgi:hypothetical protein
VVEVWTCLDGYCRAYYRGSGWVYYLVLGNYPSDPVLSEDYYQKGIDINKALESKELSDQAAKEAYIASMAPAAKARNHAQTGVKLPESATVKP